MYKIGELSRVSQLPVVKGTGALDGPRDMYCPTVAILTKKIKIHTLLNT